MLNLLEDKHVISAIFDGYKQSFFKGDLPFYPEIGQGGNTQTVVLDCGPQSTLRWEQAIELAKELQSRGQLILWKLDLGLFDRLVMPLSDEAQFCALTMALDQFNERIYPQFANDTLGVVLYEGPVDLCNQIKWSYELEEAYELFLDQRESTSFRKQLFLRNCAFDFLKLLSARLPEELILFLKVDGTMIEKRTHFFSLVSQEQTQPFHLIVKSPHLQALPYAFEATGWGFSTPMGICGAGDQKIQQRRLHQALLLPASSLEMEEEWEKLEPFFDGLSDASYRLIPEPLFTEMWDGVDELYVVPSSIDERAKRKLAGFIAAEGVVLEAPELP